MIIIESAHDSTFNALAESLRLLRSLGYPIEQTIWDVSDLPIGLQRKIHQMHLLSTITKGFENFSVFLIELQHNENYLSAHQDGRSVLDSFLRRYPQGQYLFIIAIIGQRKLILGHPQGISWRQGIPSQKFSFWSIKPAHLRKLDRWLIRGLSIKPHDTPMSIANKHRLAFKEAKQRRIILRQKKVGDFPLVLQAFLADVSRYPIPNQQQREEYALRASQGDKVACEQLIHANLRMVYSEARKYQGLGVDLMDLIQEGMTGLMRAVPKFDPSLGNQFSTYAMWWIRQAITRSIEHDSSIIRMPSYLYQDIPELLDIKHQLEEKLNREPLSIEIAIESHYFTEDEKSIAWLAQITEYTWLENALKKKIAVRARKVEHLLILARGVLPLNLPIPFDLVDKVGHESKELKKIILEDVLIDESFDLDRFIEQKWLTDVIANALSKLDEQCKAILENRFGFYDKPKTLQEVANEFKLSGERIRQIEASTLRKLRHPLRTYDLGLSLEASKYPASSNENDAVKDKIAQIDDMNKEFEKEIWISTLDDWKKLSLDERWRKIQQASKISGGSKAIPSLYTLILNYTTDQYSQRLSYQRSKMLGSISLTSEIDLDDEKD